MVMLAVLVAGCDQLGLVGDGNGDDGPTGTPADLTLEQLFSNPVAIADGRLVTVEAFLWTDGAEALLCGTVLESYPPQCGEPRLPVTGAIPDGVLGDLESTFDQPDLAQVAWGTVEVTGRVRMEPSGPRLEVVDIRVPDAGVDLG
jgi:hypothetical protein